MQPPVRGRPRSETAHAAILEASISLIRKVGYDSVTMDGIAAEAGVGKATVYRRWKSKENLVCEALERLMRAIPAPNTGTTRGDLLELMREQQGLYGDPATAELLSGLVAAMQRSRRIARVVRTSFHAARQKAMTEVVERAKRKGDLPKGTDVELLLDLFNGPLFYRFLFTGRPIDARLTHGVVDALLKAFATARRRL
jgi:AcrR family transcriptional regulator